MSKKTPKIKKNTKIKKKKQKEREKLFSKNQSKNGKSFSFTWKSGNLFDIHLKFSKLILLLILVVKLLGSQMTQKMLLKKKTNETLKMKLNRKKWLPNWKT